MRDVKDIQASSNFELEVRHNEDLHQMEIIAFRDADNEHEYMIGSGAWMKPMNDEPLVLASLPCEVYNAIVEAVQATLYIDLASSFDAIASSLVGGK